MQQSFAAQKLAALISRIPKVPDRVVVVGRAKGLFIDNGKYAFLHLSRHAPTLRTSFMTFEPDPAQQLQAKGLNAFCFTDPDGPAQLARAGIVVSDDFWWKIKTAAIAR